MNENTSIELKDIVTDCFQEILDMDRVSTDIRFSTIVGEQMYFHKNDELGIDQAFKDLIVSNIINKMSMDDYVTNHLGISVRIDYKRPPRIDDKKQVKEYFDFKFHLEKTILEAIDRMKNFHNRIVSKSDISIKDSKLNRISILIFPSSY
jgi:hypothetical protein